MKLTNFFGNPGAGQSRATSGVQSVAKSAIANANKNAKLIGGNQITNDVRQAPLLEQRDDETDQ